MDAAQYARRVELYSPDSDVEVLMLKSVLDAAGIDYFVQNDTFGGLMPGLQIALCNRRTFFVWEDELAEARAVVREFLHKTRAREPRHYPLREKIRMVFEVLLFGWLVPGRRHRQRLPELRLIRSQPPGSDEPAPRTPDERSSMDRRGPPKLELVHSARPRRRPSKRPPWNGPPAPAGSDPVSPSGSGPSGAPDRKPER